jgi:excisionase family DNA binding protein
MSVREVAARLRVSTVTIYSLCDRGELVYLRVSGPIRVLPEALEAFIRGLNEQKLALAHGLGGQALSAGSKSSVVSRQMGFWRTTGICGHFLALGELADNGRCRGRFLAVASH